MLSQECAVCKRRPACFSEEDQHLALAALEKLGLTPHQQRRLCQTLQHRDIALVKRKRLWRENLDQSHHLPLIPDGCSHDRTHAEPPANYGFNPGIGLGVITTQRFSRTNAFPGEPRMNIYMGSKWWPAASYARPAHHRTTLDERDGGASPA
jgi:hypothetical protein